MCPYGFAIVDGSLGGRLQIVQGSLGACWLRIFVYDFSVVGEGTCKEMRTVMKEMEAYIYIYIYIYIYTPK